MAYTPYNVYKGEYRQRLKYYSSDDVPAKDFLMSLDKKMRAKLSVLIGIFIGYGNLLREQ